MASARLFAADTEVPAERTQGEIYKLLRVHGAAPVAVVLNVGAVTVMFQLNSRTIRLAVPLPTNGPPRDGRGRITASKQAILHAREIRRRWRSLLLVLRAKLEAVQSGIVTFESEWLAYIVTTDGKTVGEKMAPQLDAIAHEGDMPVLYLPSRM